MVIAKPNGATGDQFFLSSLGRWQNHIVVLQPSTDSLQKAKLCK
jgi:hypothetical protein